MYAFFVVKFLKEKSFRFFLVKKSDCIFSVLENVKNNGFVFLVIILSRRLTISLRSICIYTWPLQPLLLAPYPKANPMVANLPQCTFPPFSCLSAPASGHVPASFGTDLSHSASLGFVSGSTWPIPSEKIYLSDQVLLLAGRLQWRYLCLLEPPEFSLCDREP